MECLNVLQHREDRRRQENDGLQQQNDWFQAEIREKTQQLLSARKDQAATILQLQAQLDEKSTEVCGPVKSTHNFCSTRIP